MKGLRTADNRPLPLLLEQGVPAEARAAQGLGDLQQLFSGEGVGGPALLQRGAHIAKSVHRAAAQTDEQGLGLRRLLLETQNLPVFLLGQQLRRQAFAHLGDRLIHQHSLYFIVFEDAQHSLLHIRMKFLSN